MKSQNPAANQTPSISHGLISPKRRTEPAFLFILPQVTQTLHTVHMNSPVA